MGSAMGWHAEASTKSAVTEAVRRVLILSPQGLSCIRSSKVSVGNWHHRTRHMVVCKWCAVIRHICCIVFRHATVQ